MSLLGYVYSLWWSLFDRNNNENAYNTNSPPENDSSPEGMGRRTWAHSHTYEMRMGCYKMEYGINMNEDNESNYTHIPSNIINSLALFTFVLANGNEIQLNCISNIADMVHFERIQETTYPDQIQSSSVLVVIVIVIITGNTFTKTYKLNAYENWEMLLY